MPSDPERTPRPAARRWRARGGRWARAAIPPLTGLGARVLGLYLVLALALFRRAWLSPRTRWIGSCCDPEQTMWYLRWAPYAIGHANNLLFTDRINYPDGVNLMWNTPTTLAAVVLSPVTALLGVIVAYNVLITAAVTLSAWCAFLALRRYAQGSAGPVVGGLVYGFSPYVLPQALLHADLALACVPPLMLLAVDELAVRRRRPRRAGALLGLLAFAQLLTTEEMLADEIGAAVLLVAVAAALRPRAVLDWGRAVGEGLLVAAASFAALAALPLAEQFLGPQRLHGKVVEPDVFVTDLLNVIVPTEAQRFAPDAAVSLTQKFTGLTHEANAYLGLPLLVLLAFAAGRLWPRAEVRIASLLAVLVFIFSLGPRLHIGGAITGVGLPWAWVARLPLAEDALPSRLSVILFLCVSLILCVFVDRALAAPGWRARAPALVAVAVALVPLLPRDPFPSTVATIPALFHDWGRLGLADGGTVVIAPFIRDGGEADPMLWQAVADDRFAMPQGFYFVPDEQGRPIYGAVPSALSDIMETIQEKGVVVRVLGPALRAVDTDLRRRRVGTVVVGPMSHRDEMVNFFSLLFNRPPEEIGEAEVWRHVDTQGVDLGAG